MKFLTITLIVLLSIISIKCHGEECIQSQRWKDYKLKYDVDDFDSEEKEREACTTYEETLDKLVTVQKQRASLSYTVGETGVMHINFTNYRGVVADDVNFAKRRVINRYQPRLRINQIPKSFSWYDQGFRTKVKHQGICGSCYSFSSIGGIEGQNFICNKDTKSLSEQYLLDCSPYARGCLGAFPANIADLASTKSIPYEQDYPYALSGCSENAWKQHISGRPQSACYTRNQCQQTNRNGFKIDTVEHIESGNEDHLLTALYEVGPVLITISLGNDINIYKNDIYDSTQCSPTRTDHAVLLVGYTPEYYLIKNSWGTNWGLSGYMKLARKSNNRFGTCAVLAHMQAIRKNGCRNV